MPETTAGNLHFFTNASRVNGSPAGRMFDDSGRPTIAVSPAFDLDLEPQEVEDAMTDEEVLHYAMRLAAVRTFLKVETRSFAEIAKELGVTRASISRIYRQILKSVGALRVYQRAERRVAETRRTQP